MSSRDSKSIASRLKYELIQSETEDKGNYMIKQSRDFTKGISADCQFLHSKILIYTVFAVVNTSSSRKKYETLSIAEIGMIQYSKIKHYLSANADMVSTTFKVLSFSKQFEMYSLPEYYSFNITFASSSHPLVHRKKGFFPVLIC